jgi:2'-5' RNA ligase
MKIFEKEDQDVLVFDVRKDRFLDESNRNLRILPYENEYPVYTPHITIAYLKKGTAAKYLTHDHDGKMVKTTEIVYTKDLTVDSVKLFTEHDVETKLFSEILAHFDPIDKARLSSLIK